MPYRIPRRHLVASLTALGYCGLLPHVRAAKAVSSEQTARPLAERLAAYADDCATRISMLRRLNGSNRTSSIRSGAASRRSREPGAHLP